MHRHEQDDWEGYPKVRCVEVAPSVCLRQMGRAGKPEGFISGFIVSHEVTGGGYRCEGAISVDAETAAIDGNGNPKLWTMTGSLEGGTLTLAPSIQCTVHPEFHAYIQNGRWTG